MENKFILDIGNVTYTMTPANAMTSWSALKTALGLLSKVDVTFLFSNQPDNNVNNDEKNSRLGLSILTAIASHLGDPAVKQMEDIVLSHTSAQVDEGKPYRLTNDLNSHFNQYRSHLIQVLIAGLKYQFGDFFVGGGGLLNNILPSQTTAK